MYNSDSSGEERVLADRLRREAEAGRPEFSATLHRRLCHAIRCRETTTEPRMADHRARSPASGWLLRHGLATALAAAGILALTAIAWQVMKDDGLPRRGVNPSLAGAPVRHPTVLASAGANVATDTPSELDMVGDLADRASEEIGILLESTVTQPHWAYLDQNTKAALVALNKRVPLDAVASLVFADESTDSWWESPDQ